MRSGKIPCERDVFALRAWQPGREVTTEVRVGGGGAYAAWRGLPAIPERLRYDNPPNARAAHICPDALGARKATRKKRQVESKASRNEAGKA